MKMGADSVYTYTRGVAFADGTIQTTAANVLAETNRAEAAEANLQAQINTLMTTPIYTSIALANPAAGAPAVATVPAGTQWKVNGLNFSVVTSAVVANRTAFVTAKDVNGRIMLQAFAAQSSAAGQVCVVSFGHGENTLTATVNYVYLTAQMASVVLGPGATLTISFVNLQAGDQISGITLMVETLPS